MRNAILGEALKRHLKWPFDQHLVSSGSKRCRIGTQNRLGALRLLHLVDQLRIPLPRKAAMRIDLQKPILTTPEFHHLRPGPASSPALAPVNRQNPEAIVVTERQRI